jgi:prophage regulatory protein
VPTLAPNLVAGTAWEINSAPKIERREPTGDDKKRQDTTEKVGTIFGTLAGFFRIANSTPRGAQPTPADGVNAMPVSERIIRLPTVLNRTGLSRSTLYRKIAEGTFPAQVQISVHGAGWWESAINRWIADPPGYRAENDNRPLGDGPV